MDEDKTNIMIFEICRLCLEERGYLVIFDKDELLDDIYKCTGLKISPTDNLPKKICKICLDVVIKATELRVLALKNDIQLKSLFDCPEDEAPEKIDIASLQENQTTLVREESLKEHNNAPISVRKDLFRTCKTEHNQDWKEELDVANSQNLIQQMKPEKEIGNTEYECPVCQKKFKIWKKLYIHHRLHNKCYNCPKDKCSKKFATKGDLQKHIRTHTGEKPYACNVCDRSFAQRGTLKAHKENVHNS